MSLTELAELIRHVDLNPEDEAAITRLRAQLRASDSNALRGPRRSPRSILR
jgi:hypothetical protein